MHEAYPTVEKKSFQAKKGKIYIYIFDQTRDTKTLSKCVAFCNVFNQSQFLDLYIGHPKIPLPNAAVEFGNY